MNVNSFYISLVVICYPVSIFADTKVTSKYTSEGQVTELLAYHKGERLRYQYGKDVTLLRDCGQKRIVDVDDKNKTFLSLPEDQQQAPQPTVSNITPIDTGEKKQICGRTARHLKLTQSIDDGRTRVETDGWYIDFTAMPS